MYFVSRRGPIISLLILLVLGYSLTGCGTSKSRIEATLSRYKAGDEVAPLIDELNLAGRPCFYYPNLPMGEEIVGYFLPEGTVKVSTRLTNNRKVVLSYNPLFIEDSTPVADRSKKSNVAMDGYAKAHQVPMKTH